MTTQLKIKVVAGARQSKIVGFLADELKIKITVAAEKGLANKAVINLLAQQFQLKKQHIQIISGKTSTHKTIEFKHISCNELNQKLSRYKQ